MSPLGALAPGVSAGHTISAKRNQFITERTQAEILDPFSPNEPKRGKFQNIFIYERTQQLVDNTQNSNIPHPTQSAPPATPNLRYSGDSNA
jgi:hypothetical protein